MDCVLYEYIKCDGAGSSQRMGNAISCASERVQHEAR